MPFVDDDVAPPRARREAARHLRGLGHLIRRDDDVVVVPRRRERCEQPLALLGVGGVKLDGAQLPKLGRVVPREEEEDDDDDDDDDDRSLTARSCGQGRAGDVRRRMGCTHARMHACMQAPAGRSA